MYASTDLPYPFKASFTNPNGGLLRNSGYVCLGVTWRSPVLPFSKGMLLTTRRRPGLASLGYIQVPEQEPVSNETPESRVWTACRASCMPTNVGA